MAGSQTLTVASQSNTADLSILEYLKNLTFWTSAVCRIAAERAMREAP